MGFISGQPQKTRELRERYRRSRRKQQALFTLLGCGVLLLVGAVWGGWWLLHRHAGAAPGASGLPAATHSVTTSAAKPLKLAGERNFDAAPWAFEVDGDGFYYFADSKHSLETRPNYPCDTIGAVPAKGGKSRWEVQGDFPVEHNGLDAGLDLVDGTLVTLTLRLTDKQLELAGWNTDTGAQAWKASVAGATDGVLRGVGQNAILTCRLADGWRMIAYNAKTGAKAWGVKLPLRGLKRDSAAGPAGPSLERRDDTYAAVYTCGNVIGVVDPANGKLRHEYAATGQLIETEVVEQSQTAYIEVQGNQQGSVSIVAVPLAEGASHAVLNLQSVDAKVLYAASQHWLLTCAREAQGASTVLRVRCQPLDSAAKQFIHDVPGGHAVCAALVPGDEPEFLLGVTAVDTDKAPAQPSAETFAAVLPERAEVDDAGKTQQPVLNFVVFQSNVLAFADGGVLYRFDGKHQRFVNFRKLRYPQLFARLSDDRTTLLVGSSTEQYFDEALGNDVLGAGDSAAPAKGKAAPLQIMILQ